jgi:hypothetical protein
VTYLTRPSHYVSGMAGIIMRTQYGLRIVRTGATRPARPISREVIVVI